MNGKYLILFRIRTVIFLIFTAGIIHQTLAQRLDSVPVVIEPIKILARISSDSIMLRWAPESFEFWQDANKNGYGLERYTIARNGRVLQQPEKIILTNSLLKPFAEN